MSVNETGSILVPLPPGCREGKFIRRHKRFCIEFELSGEKVWCHTNNTGAMLGLVKHGQTILVSPARSEKRKFPWTLERVLADEERNIWVGVNTALPNLIFKRAFEAKLLDFTSGHKEFQGEVSCGSSRFDACLTAENTVPLWVECKNVTLVENGIAAFPDAESTRARKHMLELIERCRAGEDAAMFFLVQRSDCCAFAPADYVDPEYARLFYQALDAGVKMRAWQTFFSCSGTGLGKPLKILSREEYYDV